MNIKYQIKMSKKDGDIYVVFDNEYDCMTYCNNHNINPDISCFNGYMNAFSLKDLPLLETSKSK